MLRRLIKAPLYSLGLGLAPSLMFAIQHYSVHRRLGKHAYWANVRNPRTFNEYMLRSKLDKEHLGLENLVDKYEVKSWVRDKIGEMYVIPSLGIFDSAIELIESLEIFPCIIKPTHLSGRILFLKKQAVLKSEAVRLQSKLDSWLRSNFYYECGEIQYKAISPRLLVEPDLSSANDCLSDYKFFCFGGAPTFIQLDSGRHGAHQRFFLNLGWERLPFSKGDFRKVPSLEIQPPPPPKRLGEMIEIAGVLSTGHRFVRVDLYEANGAVKFGEMTFHPGSGTSPFSSFDADLAVGSLLRRVAGRADG